MTALIGQRGWEISIQERDGGGGERR